MTGFTGNPPVWGRGVERLGGAQSGRAEVLGLTDTPSPALPPLITFFVFPLGKVTDICPLQTICISASVDSRRSLTLGQMLDENSLGFLSFEGTERSRKPEKLGPLDHA